MTITWEFGIKDGQLCRLLTLNKIKTQDIKKHEITYDEISSIKTTRRCIRVQMTKEHMVGIARLTN